MTDLSDWIGPFLNRSFQQLLDQDTSNLPYEGSETSVIEIESDVSNLYIRHESRKRVRVLEVGRSSLQQLHH